MMLAVMPCQYKASSCATKTVSQWDN
uniref:Uncharacterized protein n=1 Tax=Arundo donax TaxID=35708 RepID=A0A0A8YX82_ARUDO